MSDSQGGEWYHADQRRFREALTLTEAESGFNARLIEKDYYCSLVLGDLNGPFAQGLVFKGGTCLSKVHAEFFRLSEDLDFAISISPDAKRSDRRRAIAPVKEHLNGIPSRLPCFELAEEVLGHDDLRQNNGRLAYRSAVTGERDFIKLEVSLREETVLPPQILPARTMLRDPHTGQAAVPPVTVRVLSITESYAEKIRAALTRQEPVIRDFFDIHHAVRQALFDHRHPSVLDLVKVKLAVDGNRPVDLSAAKVAMLRTQLDAQLRPVLRERDYQAFELEWVLTILEEVVQAPPTGASRPA
jgi:predicted nucleotidyltransferase component of viral defense system